jgi:CDP-glucose 4,6-dehydratase
VLKGSGMAETWADLRDAAAVADAVEKAQPEVVLHLAAQPLVRRSYREPVETFETNVMGTAHLLEAVRRTRSVRAAVVVTSDKCYDNREWIWPYRENEPLGGADPYSASKGCAEILTASYRRSFFAGPEAAGIATCRAGNVFGGGDWAEDRLIPDIARAVLAGQPVVLRNPASVRPWQHVLEPLRGYLAVALRLLEGDRSAADAWNFGPAPESEIPVGELAASVVRHWGQGEIVIDPPAHAVHEARLLRLDSSKAAGLLHWKPALTLDRALAFTVDWYRASREEPASLTTLTHRQIDEYMALCGEGYV